MMHGFGVNGNMTTFVNVANIRELCSTNVTFVELIAQKIKKTNKNFRYSGFATFAFLLTYLHFSISRITV